MEIRFGSASVCVCVHGKFLSITEESVGEKLNYTSASSPPAKKKKVKWASLHTLDNILIIYNLKFHPGSDFQEEEGILWL